MRITIPIFCSTVKGDADERRYQLRPVFFTTPQVRDASLSKATSKLALLLRDHLRSHPAVAAQRPGAADEGGDGATVVTLKG